MPYERPRPPRATPAPSAAHMPTSDIAEQTLPAVRSKLAVAMDTVTAHMGEMERLGATIAEVESQYPAKHVFAVDTKDGYKLADKVRADARKSRLHVKDMRKQGTDLLNSLKQELWDVADPQMARLQAIEDNAKTQIEAHDAKEADRKRRHEDAITAITALALNIGTLSSEDIAKRMTQAEAVIVDDSYEEFQGKAAGKLTEVRDTLTAAFGAAVQREQREAEERAREAKHTAARTRIAHYKALPDAHESADVEELEVVLTTVPTRDDDAEKYGDMAEFVDMARDKALTILQAMRKAAIDTREEAARQARVVTTAPVVMESPISPEDAGALADRIESVLDADVADPFDFTADTTPLPPAVTIHRRPPPVRREVLAPVPAADPREGLDISEGDVPDLLKAAQDFIKAAEQEGGYGFFPAPLDDAYKALCAAVDFTTEFS